MKKSSNISIYLHPSIVEALKDCEPRGRSKRLAEICQIWLDLQATANSNPFCSIKQFVEWKSANLATD